MCLMSLNKSINVDLQHMTSDLSAEIRARVSKVKETYEMPSEVSHEHKSKRFSSLPEEEVHGSAHTASG